MSVELFLEVAQANDAARRFLLTVKGADAAVEELGQDLDATGRDLKQVAANTDVAARAVDDLGDEARGAAVGLRVLDHELDRVRRSTMGLAAVRAGSKLGNLIPGNWMRNGQVDFSQLVGEGRGLLITSLIGGILLTAPALGAMISGAISGVLVGPAGITAGVIAAAKDPRVGDAWSDLLGVLKDEWDEIGEDFAQPVANAIDLLADGLDRIDFSGSLRTLTPYVDDLAQALLNFLTNFMPGFTDAMVNSGPLIKVLAEEMGELGAATGDFFDDLSNNAGTAIGLRAFFTTLESLITATGIALRFLSGEFRAIMVNFYHMAVVAAKVTGGPATAAGRGWLGLAYQIGNFVETAHLGTESNEVLGESAGEAALEAMKLAEAIAEVTKRIGDLIGQHVSWERLQIALRQMRADTKAQLAGGGGIGLDSQRGRDNRSQLLDEIALLEKAREEAIKRGNNTEEAARKADLAYLREIARLMELARQAGATRAQIEALFAPVYMPIVIDLIMPGIRVVGDMIKDIFGGFFAEGGRPTPGVPAIVGEKGPEIFVPDSAGTIYPNSAVRWSGYTAGPPGGGRIVVENHLHATFMYPDGGAERRELIRDANRRGVPDATIRAAYP